MDLSQENVVISDGSSIDTDYVIIGLPLAAILCIIIVIYGLLVLICLFMRQVILNRRPLSTLESLHCCDCLLFLPRPAIKLCDIPCGQAGKSETLPCKLHLEKLWAALPSISCRLPESSQGPSSCWPPALTAAQCPSSVRCCGLEIRRDTRPGMVDASVSGGDELKSPTPTSPAATRCGNQHGAVLDPADSRHYSQHGAMLDPADSRHYSQHGAMLDPADSCHYSQHDTMLDPADSRHYIQHGAVLDPAALLKTGSASDLSTAAWDVGEVEAVQSGVKRSGLIPERT